MDVLCPCGTTFTAESRHAKYCSTRCRTRAHRGWTADRFVASDPTECVDCGASIEPPRRKRCARCNPPYVPRAPRLPTPCAQCSTLTRAKYCSQRCLDLSKRVPCAGDCGGLIYLGRGSLPAGEARCRPCRISLNAANRDAEQMAGVQRARVRAANMSPCVDCSKPSYGLRCRDCENASRRDGQLASALGPARKLLDARRADRDRQAPGIYTPSKRLALRDKWKRQGKTCLYCGVAPIEEVDHVLPLALGGTNHEGNLAPACHECNHLKLDNLLSAWRYGVEVRKWRVPVAPRMPTLRGPRSKRVVGTQTALNVCPICSALYTKRRKYCSDDCMWEANARGARDRFRAARGLPVDREAPTTPSRRVRAA